MARYQGSTLYMPAALSRYSTARSSDTTGCTKMEFMMPRNSVDVYKPPSVLVMCCSVSLQVAQQHQKRPEAEGRGGGKGGGVIP